MEGVALWLAVGGGAPAAGGFWGDTVSSMRRLGCGAAHSVADHETVSLSYRSLHVLRSCFCRHRALTFGRPLMFAGSIVTAVIASMVRRAGVVWGLVHTVRTKQNGQLQLPVGLFVLLGGTRTIRSPCLLPSLTLWR